MTFNYGRKRTLQGRMEEIEDKGCGIVMIY
jgi:hypothetical protein